MKTIDLSEKEWQVCGWRPYAWKLSYSMEMGIALAPDISPVPARVPGSVQAALQRAGLLPDWNLGLNSRLCEWVENRHWEFSTDIRFEGKDRERIFLQAEGLDYSGWILVDGREAAIFQGTLLPHRVELTDFLRDGQSHRLSIVFDEPPAEQGQIGYTSRSRFFKPRYNYSWDWCPRFVPIGIWDALYLEQSIDSTCVEKITASVEEDCKTGNVTVWLDASDEAESATVTVTLNDKACSSRLFPLRGGPQALSVNVENIRLWWPCGEGEQVLYSVEIKLGRRGGGSLILPCVKVGFKRVRWLPCRGAPADAIPWICEINGKPVFLRGVNWTPIKLDFHSVPDDDYAQRIRLYREMGCNLLRVWGGSFLEKSVFYQLCDQAGLLVWQEFPLSSSGIDNWAPEDPEAIQQLCRIASSYIRRRGHHVSKLLWCGGNELQSAPGRKTGAGVPLDGAHPCLAALAKIVEQEDPGTRFLPASASGPQFCASEENFGKGLHHDVHGPWNVNGTMENWKRYWAGDDALFRSEVGVPGTSSVDLVAKYQGDCLPWRPTPENPYWMHAGAWWMQWDQFKDALEGLSDKEAWKRYVELSSRLQADALAVAARACRDRFPACGGVVIWMGHDAFPCLANTSIIDFEGKPKLAYQALKEIFKGGAPP